jgi:hypothetical protein
MFSAVARLAFPRFAPLAAAAALGLLAIARPCLAADDEDAASGGESAGDDDSNGEAKRDDGAASAKHGDQPDKASDSKSGDGETDLGHMGQFGLRAGLVAGFRMILRYSDSPFCRLPDNQTPDRQPKFCGHGAPLATDFGLSFALLDFFEPFAWARLGLAPEKETDTQSLVVLGVGARLYTMSDSAFKLFIEPAVGFELEGGRGTPAWQANAPVYKKDLVLHVAVGPQLDFTRNIGLYATGGLSADVLRFLGSSLDLNVGLQGRLP